MDLGIISYINPDNTDINESIVNKNEVNTEAASSSNENEDGNKNKSDKGQYTAERMMSIYQKMAD
jgi:hypothetical protein